MSAVRWRGAGSTRTIRSLYIVWSVVENPKSLCLLSSHTKLTILPLRSKILLTVVSSPNGEEEASAPVKSKAEAEHRLMIMILFGFISQDPRTVVAVSLGISLCSPTPVRSGVGSFRTIRRAGSAQCSVAIRPDTSTSAVTSVTRYRGARQTRIPLGASVYIYPRGQQLNISSNREVRLHLLTLLLQSTPCGRVPRCVQYVSQNQEEFPAEQRDPRFGVA